jgi:predicted NBD/HSP70 family sugar kinase
MYVGIDIGGTKTLVAKLSDDGEILQNKRFPTNHDYDQFLKDVAANFAELGMSKPFHCCVGIPGHLNRADGIVYALGNLPWKNKPIRDDIANIVEQSVIIENDARLAGLSEAQLVKDQYQSVLFATVSTGIGGAAIYNGKLVKFLQNIEMGKMPLLHDGKYELWEDWAGGRTLQPRFGKQAFEITDPAEWQSIAEYLAYGFGPACSIIQPEVIILGGSVGKQADKYSSYIMDWLDANLHAVVRRPAAILAAQRADDAVIYGCYDLAKQTFHNA